MLVLWEMEDNFTSGQSKLEGWYQSNVWSRIIDPAFHDMKFESIIRGEGMSFASSDRKNDGKSESDRKKIGRKGDGHHGKVLLWNLIFYMICVGGSAKILYV